MRNRTVFLMVLSAFLLLVSCADDELVPSYPQNNASNIALVIESPGLVVTRSAASNNECMIEDAYALIFDGNTGTYKSGTKIDVSTSLSGTNGATERTLSLKLGILNGDKLVILANTGVSTLPAFTAGTSTLNDINSLFGGTSISGFNRTDGDSGKGMPMSGEVIFNSNATTTCVLKRSVAKIEVKLNIAPGDDVTGGFTDAGLRWKLVNLCNTGSIYSNDPLNCVIPVGLTEQSFSNQADAPTGLPNMTVDAPGVTGLRRTYYLPEYPHATSARLQSVTENKWHKDRLCIILQEAATHTFYRLELQNRSAGKYLDIRRNTRYTVNITKVKSAGYATEADAINSVGSNVDFQITEDNANVVTTNGKYALILENDEVIASVNVGEEINVGSVFYKSHAADATGVTNSITISEGATLTGATSVSDVPQDIKLAPTGTHANTTITITLDNIVKTINIYFVDKLRVAGRRVKLAPMQSAYYGAADWEKNECGVKILNSYDGFQVIYEENVVPLNQEEMSNRAAIPVFAERTSVGYSVRNKTDKNNGSGRIKLILRQMKPDYLGWFGAPDGTNKAKYTKRLIADPLPDRTNTRPLYGNADAFARMNDYENGKANTLPLKDYGSFQTDCYLKNDQNGNGQIDSHEKDAWYLPATNQLNSVWLAYEALQDQSQRSFSVERSWSSTYQGGGFYTFLDCTKLYGYIGGSAAHLWADPGQARCVRDMD